jgi:hypothetical protein
VKAKREPNLAGLEQVLAQLPDDNFVNLRYLIVFLAEMTKFADTSKVSSRIRGTPDRS